MNLKQDIKKAMGKRGWSASRLAREAEIPAPCITRILSGERKGLNSRTLEKLWPFLYGETANREQAEVSNVRI